MNPLHFMTNAHTRALTAHASRIVSRSQRHGDGAKKERAPLLEPRPPALRPLIQAYGGVYSRTAVVVTIREKTDYQVALPPILNF